MDKQIKLIILAIFTFIVFAITMFYANNAAWIMAISLISFVVFLISIFVLTLNSKSKSN